VLKVIAGVLIICSATDIIGTIALAAVNLELTKRALFHYKQNSVKVVLDLLGELAMIAICIQYIKGA
jgi:hypothetical protein